MMDVISEQAASDSQSILPGESKSGGARKARWGARKKLGQRSCIASGPCAGPG